MMIVEVSDEVIDALCIIHWEIWEMKRHCFKMSGPVIVVEFCSLSVLVA